MKRTINVLGLLAYLILAATAMVRPSSAQDAPPIEVGRVYDVVGDLFRYVPDEKDWVAVVRDAPFGAEDTLFSGNRGMSELIIPNGSWIRVGNSTQIQFIALDTDLSEVDIASGVARFYNKGSDTIIKATSPLGYVLSYPGTVFDFYVGENSVEVVAVSGRVSFVHSATGAKYDVAAGSPSILADQWQVSSGEGAVDPEWDRWNMVRESFWAAKARVRGRSAEYLPPSLRDESYALEENGRWERVPYEGSQRWFWRPITVGASWSPFTVGRWTDWYGDQTWIPAEPFGYVTHHYGNWVYARNYWYWAPPVVSVRIGLPLLNLGLYWYPGRVSWIHSGNYVGWVPLAPRETYYSHRHWGGRYDEVLTNVNVRQISINVRNYAYANRAIIVNQTNFYGVNNYRNVRVTNINPTTIINNYQAAPVVNNTVINNYTTNRQRYNYTNVAVNEKPHSTVINRIQQNEAVIRGAGKENAAALEQQAKRIPEGKVNREVRIEQPKATNYVVPANEVNRPKSEIRLQQRDIKSSGGRTAPEVRPGTAGKPEQQPTRPEQARPERGTQPRQGQQPERMAPPKTTQPEQTGRPEQAKPEGPAPARPQPSVTKPERVPPAKQEGAPAAAPERVAPVKPAPQPQSGIAGKPDQQSPRQERTKPEGAAPARPQPPVAKPERIAPARPEGPPAAAPERVTPSKPVPQPQPQVTQPAEPVTNPKRVAPPKPAQPGQPEGQEQEKQEVQSSTRSQPPKAKPERVPPPKPEGPPAAAPERVTPSKPVPPQPQATQPAKPVAKSERVAPPKPGHEEELPDEHREKEKPR